MKVALPSHGAAGRRHRQSERCSGDHVYDKLGGAAAAWPFEARAQKV
jgi:hypothetical protein